MSCGETITIREVGLRDGLQLAGSIVATRDKIEWCRLAVGAGIREIELTALVPPKTSPQFADAAKLAEAVLPIPGYVPSALVPNLKGAQRGFDLGFRKLSYVMSASEAHSLANSRRPSEASIEDFGRIVYMRNASFPDARLIAGIATAFGCTLQGDVPEARVFEIAGRLARLGADEIAVADTVGYANPGQMRRVLAGVRREVGNLPIVVHLHDTRGLGLANMMAAIEEGVRFFDASTGGLGGCPFAPGASGNINLEDAAFLAESLGFSTGIDFERLMTLRRSIEQWLPEERFVGQLSQSGLPRNFKRASARPA